MSPDRRLSRHLWPMALACIALPLGSCGLQPLYGGGGSGAVARDVGSVAVSAIEGKGGFLVRNALTDRLGGAQQGNARYRLDVRLDEKLTGMIVQSDDTVSRERRVMRARYQLVNLATGAIMLDATADADAGIDVTSSEYAVIAAEQTAQESLAKAIANQIVTNVALRLRQAATPSTAPQP